MIGRFEEALSDACGARYAVAMNSATSALHAAYLALGVTHDDVVWTTPITFVATANAAVYCGAKVDFVDIDPRTFNMSVESLEAKLNRAETLPRVVAVVHMAGQSCDMAEIHRLSKIYGFSVIEDASHALGGSYRNSPIGSCEFSDITVLSFHPVKIITTGEGGAAVTNRPEIARKLQLLRSHGITRNPAEMTAGVNESWYYEQIDIGYNYRMTDIQAALGSSQLTRLNEFVNRRNSIASFYTDALASDHLELPTVGSDRRSAFHLYVIRTVGRDANSCSARRRFLAQRLFMDNVSTNLHYIPVYRQPFYAKHGHRPIDFPNAEHYYASALTIPLYPGMSDGDVECVTNSVLRAISNFS